MSAPGHNWVRSEMVVIVGVNGALRRPANSSSERVIEARCLPFGPWVMRGVPMIRTPCIVVCVSLPLRHSTRTCSVAGSTSTQGWGSWGYWLRSSPAKSLPQPFPNELLPTSGMPSPVTVDKRTNRTNCGCSSHFKPGVSKTNQ